MLKQKQSRKPNKKNKNKNNNRRAGSTPPGSGNLVGGFQNASSSLSRVSEGFLPLFPPSTVKTLRYHDNVTVSSIAGAVSTFVFAANDLFDPNVTGTGHQPMGFDQMMVFYNHFAVKSCRIKVNATNTSTGPYHVGIRLDASPTPLTVADRIIELGGVTFDNLEAKNTYGSSKSFELSVDIARIQGIPKKNITTDPNLRGDAATSPLELTYFHIFIWDPVTGSAGSVDLDVTLDYSSAFMEPRDATESLAILSECKHSGPVLSAALSRKFKR